MARFGLLTALGLLNAWNAGFVAALLSQQPLASTEVEWAGILPNASPGGVEVDPDGWDFATAPPANSTAQLVFSTVQNLLQHWPNTRYRNGALSYLNLLAVNNIIDLVLRYPQPTSIIQSRP
jgi:hypothetical protein